jgi:NAD(P)-dependent dehydrogenase (short-subunit alcohol dehydrogenase family)
MATTWKDKVVVVTGGSSGLGVAIVEAFAQRGATVVSIARNEANLQAVVENLIAQGLSVDFELADVTDDESVRGCIDRIVTKRQHIDVWVNNVGQSTRASFADVDVEVYRQFMEVNFLSAVRCTQFVMPHLEVTSGSIVNIGSLAAKTGWRHVAPYVTSKHALAGFAHQLRLEGPDNVHSMFVCPGPIRRNDAGQRYASESEALDNAANKPGGGVNLKGIRPEKLASAIVRGIEKRKPEIVMPGKTRILFSILQLWPRLGDWILNRSAS